LAIFDAKLATLVKGDITVSTEAGVTHCAVLTSPTCAVTMHANGK